jgi:Family of unknown function (DUF5677)
MPEPDVLLTEEEIERRSLALAKQLRIESSEMRRYRRYGLGFKRRLAKTWSEPLNLYEVVLKATFDAWSEFSQEHWAQAQQESDFRFETLVSLHAQASLVAGEVLELLKGGYRNGAHARCRTLHELAVFAGVIAEHPEVAERFLAHDAIEDAKSLDTYQQKLAGRPGYVPYSKEDVDTVHVRRDEAVAHFGDAFGKGYYGWAVPLFPPKANLTFEKLEELAGLGHWRPWYDWATHLGVHASSRGVRLNLLTRGDVTAALAGPTNIGLSDPGEEALISLLQVTTSLLVHGRPITGDPTPAVVLKALLTLTHEAGEAFVAAEQRLAEKEAKVQAEAKPAAGGALHRLLGRVAPWWHPRNPR